MSDVITTVDNSYDTELDNAFLEFFDNPDGLTGRQLLKLHVDNFLMDCLNRYRKKSAIDSAVSGVIKATDLSVAE